MKHKFLQTSILFLLFASAVSAQTTKEDYSMVLSNGETLSTVHRFRGDSLFKLGKVKQAIVEYRLQNKEKYSICQYELASAFAKNLQYDSAFRYLNLNLQYDWTEYVLINPDFLPMMSDPRWDLLVNRWIDSVNLHQPNKIKDILLAKLLWRMYAADQAYYYELQVIQPNMHDSSALSQTFWRLKNELNERNHVLLDSIIKAKGWPKISQVGNAASNGAFMVVQHMTEGQQEAYLPLIKACCVQGEAEWDSYAYVYDKICCFKKKPQYYGSQVVVDPVTGLYFFYPIEDEANVNKRRAEMGMVPIEKYAESFGFIYSPTVDSGKKK